MTKSNEQLTMELNALSNRVQGLADSLENMMPKSQGQGPGVWDDDDEHLEQLARIGESIITGRLNKQESNNLW